MGKLLYQLISLCASITVCLNEVSDMLFEVALTIELVELGRLIAMGHAKSINPLHTKGFVYKWVL